MLISIANVLIHDGGILYRSNASFSSIALDT